MFKQYNDFLMVSDNGEVIKLSTTDRWGRVTEEYSPKKYDNGNGYDYINVNYHGSVFQKGVHRLVAEMFIPNPNGLKEIHHIDGNKKNNHVDNLMWISKSDHNARGVKAVEKAITTKIKKYGKPFYIFNDNESLYFESVKQCSDFLSVSRTAVRLALQGKNKTVKGYQCKYKE